MDRKSAVRENTSQPSLWIVGKLKALTTTCASSDVPGTPSYPSTANVHASTTSLRPFRIVTSRLAPASPASGVGNLPCATIALAIRVPCSDFAPVIASTPKSPANATRSPARGTRPSSPSAPLRAASRSEYGTGLTPSAMKYAIPADTSGYPSSPGSPVVALYVSIDAIGLARETKTSVGSNTLSSFMSRYTRSYSLAFVVSTTRRPRAPNSRCTVGAGWKPKWNALDALVSPTIEYCSISRHAQALRLTQPGEKSRFWKSMLRSRGTVSCAREPFSCMEKSDAAIPGGSPRSARGIANSLNSCSPNWNAACAPPDDSSEEASQTPA